MLSDSIERFFSYVFGRNWRTSALGIIAVAAQFVAANPQFVKNDLIVAIAQFIALGGGIGFAINAKDRQVSGVPLRHMADDNLAEIEAQRGIEGDRP